MAPQKQPESKPTAPPQTSPEPLADHRPEPVRNELGQVIASAEPRSGRPAAPFAVQPPIQDEWTKQASEYLTANGWELVGHANSGTGIWRDPASAGDHRGTRVQVGTLPKPNAPGSTEPLVQMVVPVQRWDRTTDEALQLQRMRDAFTKLDNDISPLERIDRLTAKNTATIDTVNKLAHSLEASLKRPIPEKPENVRVELARLRREVQAAVMHLRSIDRPQSAVA